MKKILKAVVAGCSVILILPFAGLTVATRSTRFSFLLGHSLSLLSRDPGRYLLVMRRV